jgi:phospholipid/cholesterol/gamma-HCH transport system substrate-binding protein
MRKALIAIGLIAVVAVVALLLNRDGDDDAYLVRAVFDNGAFLVEGEEVRVAGATVGTIESVGVTMPGEAVSYEDGRWREAPGKAVLVLKIEDAGFQDFRRDATCLIRPQSLIGEKFVDCRPTLPRAPGSPPPPPLKEVPDGEPGAGQHLLPLEQNSTSVDPDLINNINRLPYTQRFRLVLNELGASLAGRGEDIEEIVKRSNPTLRDLDRLLGILTAQRDQLAQLASDGERILEPFSRERAHVAGFFSNAGAAAEATTERGEQLEASLRKLPGFLREFQTTLVDLKGFSDAATPVFANLNDANPAFARATRSLTPFFAASTVSLRSLGATGEIAGPNIRAADPIVRKARDLARSGASPTTRLAKFLVNTKQTKGFDGLVDLIYNSAAATNEFDQYGHFLRTVATLADCAEYLMAERSGCSGKFTGPKAAVASSLDEAAIMQRIQETLAEESGGTAAGPAVGPPPPAASEVAPPALPELGEGEEIAPAPDDESSAEPEAEPQSRDLLDYLLGR